MPRRQLGSLSRPSGSGKPCRVSQAGLSRKRGGYRTRFNGKAERNVRVEARQLPGTRGPFSTPAASRESPAQPAGTRSWLRGGVLGRVRVAIHRGSPPAPRPRPPAPRPPLPAPPRARRPRPTLQMAGGGPPSTHPRLKGTGSLASLPWLAPRRGPPGSRPVG